MPIRIWVFFNAELLYIVPGRINCFSIILPIGIWIYSFFSLKTNIYLPCVHGNRVLFITQYSVCIFWFCLRYIQLDYCIMNSFVYILRMRDTILFYIFFLNSPYIKYNFRIDRFFPSNFDVLTCIIKSKLNEWEVWLKKKKIVKYELEQFFSNCSYFFLLRSIIIIIILVIIYLIKFINYKLLILLLRYLWKNIIKYIILLSHNKVLN